MASKTGKQWKPEKEGFQKCWKPKAGALAGFQPSIWRKTTATEHLRVVQPVEPLLLVTGVILQVLQLWGDPNHLEASWFKMVPRNFKWGEFTSTCWVSENFKWLFWWTLCLHTKTTNMNPYSGHEKGTWNCSSFPNMAYPCHITSCSIHVSKSNTCHSPVSRSDWMHVYIMTTMAFRYRKGSILSCNDKKFSMKSQTKLGHE